MNPRFDDVIPSLTIDVVNSEDNEKWLIDNEKRLMDNEKRLMGNEKWLNLP